MLCLNWNCSAVTPCSNKRKKFLAFQETIKSLTDIVISVKNKTKFSERYTEPTMKNKCLSLTHSPFPFTPVLQDNSAAFPAYDALKYEEFNSPCLLVALTSQSRL